jgi:hypothetical protein
VTRTFLFQRTPEIGAVTEKRMLVANVQRTPLAGGGEELSAEVDGFRLWFRFPRPGPRELRADPWIAALLVPAMVTGEALRFEQPLPASPRLLAGTREIQAIFHSWNRAFHKVEIIAGPHTPGAEGRGIASFFSGGVDGTYTFLKHQAEIEYLVLANGFDFVSQPKAFAETVQRNGGFAARHSKQLLAIETNYYDFGRRYRLSRAATFGGCLASMAHSLGFGRVYIAGAGDANNISPEGSHPLLDPLWTTEACRIVHDGLEASRADRTAVVARDPDAILNLRVCWQDPNKNCGACLKCLRTMITLRLLGVGEAAYFGRALTTRDVLSMNVRDAHELAYLQDNLDLAVRLGNETWTKVLRHRIWRYQARDLTRDVDRLLFGGAIRRVRRWVRPVAPEDAPDIWPTPQTI